jgi:hypothetical protein
MDTPTPISSPTSSPISDGLKNVLIMILLVILVLSLLGINVFTIFGNALQKLIDVFNPIVSKVLKDLGYASGNVISSTSDIVADTSKTGIDILNGTVHSVGDLLLKASGQGSGASLDSQINQPPIIAPKPPSPNESSNPIQSTPSVNKNHWCLVGEYNGARGCISVSDQDKCLSGQVFPTQQLCLNPNLTQNKP